jgi:hypothetical protein
MDSPKMDEIASAQLRNIVAGIVAIDTLYDQRVKNRWIPQIPIESAIDTGAMRKARAEEKRERRAKKRGARSVCSSS